MRKCASLFIAVALLATGYLLGSANVFSPAPIQAQEDLEKAVAEANSLSEDTRQKIEEARNALEIAQDALISEGFMKPGTKGINPIAILAGGVDVMGDLERGLGVDPGTFAALYAGLAIDEVDEQLGRDAEGRLTYKKKLIQMYPVSKIKSLYNKANIHIGDN